MFIWPLMFMNRGNGVSALQFLFMSMAQFTLMATFYANYLWLTPKYFVEGDKRIYFILNIAIIIGLSIGLHYWMEMTGHMFDHAAMPPTSRSTSRWYSLCATCSTWPWPQQ